VKDIKRKKDSRKSEPHPQTTIVNNIQREKSRAAVRQALSWLSTTFPKAFNVEGAIRPLKVNIDKDILEYAKNNGGLPISMSKFRMALIVFTRRMEYLTCVKMRNMRVDLNGEEVEQVSEEASQLAVLQIKKIVEKSSRIHRKMAPPRGKTFPPRRGPSGPGQGPSHHAHSSHGQAAPKRRYTSPYGSPQENIGNSSNSNTGNGNYYDNNRRESREPREPREPNSYGYAHNTHNEHASSSTPATIKVKKRYVSPATSPAAASPSVEVNYNSETYNTETSTVDRFKAKLGIKPRIQRK